MKKYYVVLMILLIFTVVVNASGLEVYYLSVRDGNAVFIRTPSGLNILIDGGPGGSGSGYDAGADTIVPFLRSLGVTRIDNIIISNPKESNIGGLRAVFDAFDIGEIFAPETDYTPALYEDLLIYIMEKQDELAMAGGSVVADALSRKYHFEYTTPSVGYNFSWGSGISAQVIGPKKMYRNTRSDIHNNSLVIKMTYKTTSFLFTGDIEREAMRDLTRLSSKLQCDVLKVPQQGNVNSSDMTFLQTVNPKYAIISAGGGKVPSSAILKNLSALKVNTYRTDQGVSKYIRVKVGADGSAPSITKK